MSEYHNTVVKFTGSGCRAHCLARGCNWMGRNHRILTPRSSALAWYQAKEEGRHHTADQQRAELERRRR